MGIHGLTTYLRKNRAKLAHTVEFRSTAEAHDARTPLVVDAWSFIYELMHCADLPWVYGGEYEALSTLVPRVVEAWLDVGFRLHFVFDGPYPSLKFPTIVSRISQTNVQGGLLFFRTSTAARSTPRFLHETSILPPLTYTVCVRALLDIASSRNTDTERLVEVHFADEEADPYAVALAGRLNAYVTGNDSDYVVLNTDGYKGYIPMDEIVWNSTSLSPSTSRAESVYSSVDGDFDVDDGGFRPVRGAKKTRKRAAANHRVGKGLLPPDDFHYATAEMTLTFTVYPPSALAEHLQLPVSLLPLLGALVGNDFTGAGDDLHPSSSQRSGKKDLKRMFFDRQLTLVERISRVASTLRSILTETLSPPAQKKQQKKQVGSVLELIDAAVTALLLRPIDTITTGEREAIVERIVEATLQYAIPRSETDVQDGEEEDAQVQDGGNGSTPWASDVCVLHTREECPLYASLSHLASAYSTLASSESGSNYEDDQRGVTQTDNPRARISELYIGAYRRGALSPHAIDPLNTGTSWPRLFLEDPDKETVMRILGRPIREWGYALLDQGLGLPVRPGDEEDDTAAVDDGDDELVDVVEDDDDDDLLAPLRGALEQLDHSGQDVTDSSMTAERPLIASLPSSKTARHKIVVEYLRRGTHMALEEVSVPFLSDVLTQHSIEPPVNSDGRATGPVQLWPEDVRMTLLLRTLQSDVTHVRALQGDVLMAVLAVRWVIMSIHARAQHSGGNREKDKERWTRDEARAILAALSWSSLPETLPSSSGEPSAPIVPIIERNVQLVAQACAALESIEHFVQILLLQHRVPSPARRFSGQRCHEMLTMVGKDTPFAVDDAVWEACVEAQATMFAEPPSKTGRKERKFKGAATARLPSGGRERGKGSSAAGGGMFSLLADVDV